MEEKAWEESVEVPVEERDKFNKWISQKGNYKYISEVLINVLGVTQEEIDKVYDRDPEMMKFTEEIAQEGSRYPLMFIEYEKLYRDVK